MRAIIIEHENNGTHVLGCDGGFRFVKGYLTRPIGAEVELYSAPAVNYVKYAAIAACFVLFLALGSFGWMWNAESYSVYVDINPSIELVFNNLDRLKTANPVNEDGAALLKDLRLRGRPGDVVVGLIQAAEDRGYLFMDGDVPGVSITVVARSGKAPDKCYASIEAALTKNMMQDFVSVETCDRFFSDKAAAMGISPGKLKLAERLFAADQSIAVDELVNMPVKELVREIRDAEKRKATASEEKNPNAGPGNNSGNGNTDPGNNNNNQESNPNAGPGNNSGNGNTNPGNNNDQDKNPNAGPGNNSGNGNTNPGGGNNKDKNPNAGPGNNSGNGNTNPGNGGGTNPDPDSDSTVSPDPGSSGDKEKEKNPNAGPGNNSGNGNTNPGGTGNTNPGETGNTNPGETGNTNPGGTGNPDPGETGNTDPGGTGNPGNSEEKDKNPNAGPGNNSGNGNTNPGGTGNTDPGGDKDKNPNAGPGKDSSEKDKNPNAGPGNNSSDKDKNPNAGPGNNSGKD